MATTADALGIGRGRKHEPPNIISTYPEQSGDVTHLEEEQMPSPPSRRDAEFDLRESLHIVALSSTQTSEAVKALAVQVQALATVTKPTGWIDRWVPFLGGLMIVGVGWIANGIYVARGTEGDLRTQLAVLSEKIAQAEERQKERERVGDRERALIAEQNRQISIQLEARGIRIPKQ